jgi:hypothetical protein
MRIHVGPEGSTMTTMLHEPYVASVAAWPRRMLAEATTAPTGTPIHR